MLTGLKSSLADALKKITKSHGIDKALVTEIVKDLQRALITADIDVKIIFAMTEKIEHRMLNDEVVAGLSRKQHAITIIHEEMTKIMGNESDFEFQPGKQNKIMLLGIQGSGKTTSITKLSRFLTKQGYKIGIIGADTYRPGALDQLKQSCEKSNIVVYGENKNDDSVSIVTKGLKHFAKESLDIILIDTAGRHKEETNLLKEMGEIQKAANPDLALLVIDGTIGRQCFSQADAFNKTIPVGGIIVTKLDSSAKGGGALSASAATGAKIMYIGTGEKPDDFQKFTPTDFIGRLLGISNIKSILEFAKNLEQSSDQDQQRRISSGKMSIDDFYSQIQQLEMPSLKGLVENLQGVSVKQDQLEQATANIEKWRFIIQSMTKTEKRDPTVLGRSRIKRIARGSGTSEIDVKNMIKSHKQANTTMKAAHGREGNKLLRKMGLT